MEGQPRGMWVVMHVSNMQENHSFMGYYVGAEGGMHKIVKIATTVQSPSGWITDIKEGVWLFNPMHVWLIEHEHEIPIAGIRAYDEDDR